MRRSILKSLCVAAVLTPFLLSGCAGGPRILLYVRDGSWDPEYMLAHEVGVMRNMLKDARFRVVVATPSGKPVVGKTATLKADLPLQEVTVSDYDGFLLPCMAAGAPGMIEPQAVEMVKEAAALGKPVAAQYGSVYTLARAGLLSDRRYAFGGPVSPEGTYVGTGVVGDRNVFTSGTCSYQALETDRPDGTPELTRLFIEAVAAQTSR